MVGTITTTRLSLRPLVRADADLVAALNSDREVMRYITGRPSTADEVRLEVDESLGTRWVASDRDGTRLGWVGAVPIVSTTGEPSEFDIGWRFHRASWGQGYATEAGRALMDELFAAGAGRVFAQTMAVNERSRAVMERIGLRYARTFHLEFEDPLPGTELGEVEYELTRSEWQASA